jgi:hypothetical protein
VAVECKNLDRLDRRAKGKRGGYGEIRTCESRYNEKVATSDRVCLHVLDLTGRIIEGGVRSQARLDTARCTARHTCAYDTTYFSHQPRGRSGISYWCKGSCVSWLGKIIMIHVNKRMSLRHMLGTRKTKEVGCRRQQRGAIGNVRVTGRIIDQIPRGQVALYCDHEHGKTGLSHTHFRGVIWRRPHFVST